jgi:hypothetical protein
LHTGKISAVIKENMEIPKKTINRTAIRSSNPTTGYTSKKMNSVHGGGICSMKLIAALFTTAKRRKEPKHLSAGDG